MTLVMDRPMIALHATVERILTAHDIPHTEHPDGFTVPGWSAYAMSDREVVRWLADSKGIVL